MKQHNQVMMPLSKLKHIDRNARVHSPEQIQQITESLKKYGFVAPIVIDSKGTVYAGNGRLQAAKNLEMTEVPCVMLEGLSKAEMRAYALVDNRLSETSSWDKDILKIELEELALDIDLDLSVVGFSADEIEAMLAGDFLGIVADGVNMPVLPDGDKSEFQNMTFILHDEQAEIVKTSLEKAKKMGKFLNTTNENSNGNALARICELFLGGDNVNS
jgi:ParB-like chromosome segregation protein Spo0J